MASALILTGCGNSGGGLGGIFGGGSNQDTDAISPERQAAIERNQANSRRDLRGTVWELFGVNDDPNTTIEVNKYIWNASLDVLNFLPVEAADPFSGILVTGYGVPPGGGRAYRATVLVRDPALDARSLNLALSTRSGPVSRQTVQAVEDAILTRARQLRIADGRL